MAWSPGGWQAACGISFQVALRGGGEDPRRAGRDREVASATRPRRRAASQERPWKPLAASSRGGNCARRFSCYLTISRYHRPWLGLAHSPRHAVASGVEPRQGPHPARFAGSV